MLAGVATHSSGNHGQALALAAHIRQTPAFIVVPRDTPKCKLEAMASYNGRCFALTVECRASIDVTRLFLLCWFFQTRPANTETSWCSY